MRLFITGATGFIGKHTLPLLVGKGFEVHAISSKPVQSDNNYIWHQADLLKINELEDLLAQVSPSHLLHFAWYSEPKKYWTSPKNLQWLQSGLNLLEGFKKNGGEINTATRVDSAVKNGDSWLLETKMGEIPVDIVINASGAWGDKVASRAGIEPVGLEPRRRTAFTVNRKEPDIQDWDMIADINLRFYCKPDGRQLLCSLAEENPSEPCDAKHDETDVALAIERLNEATTLDIRSVQTAWTGLRTFVPDRSMVIGADPADDSFFWCVGQGGTGIMTSPGVGRLLADLVTLGKPSEHFEGTGLNYEEVSVERLRKK